MTDESIKAEIELLPCPFCGGSPTTRSCCERHINISCQTCHYQMISSFTNREVIIGRWNTRKLASEQTADLRERLEAEESRADHYYKLHLGEHCFEDCLYCTEDYL